MTKENLITKSQYDKAVLIVGQYERQQKEKKGHVLHYRTKTSSLSIINPLRSIPNSVNSVSVLFVVKRVKKLNKKEIEAKEAISGFIDDNGKSYTEIHRVEDKNFDFGKIKTDSLAVIDMIGDSPLDWNDKGHCNLYNTLKFHKKNNNTIFAITDSFNLKLYDSFSFIFIADYALNPVKREKLINGITRFSF